LKYEERRREGDRSLHPGSQDHVGHPCGSVAHYAPLFGDPQVSLYVALLLTTTELLTRITAEGKEGGQRQER